jgi:gamma-glutamyl hercynylcysteine S-oxide synthase
MSSRKRFSRPEATAESISAVYVASGTFTIGSERPDESPAVKVALRGFWIGQYPVTNEQFAWFIRGGGYSDESVWTSDAFRWARSNDIREPAFWRDERFNGPEQPVTGVSFHEAAAFARWLGGRLPTEIEWEAAGRSEDGRTYPWGERAPTLRMASFAPGFVPRRRAPSEVRKLRQNVSPFGCRQMAGNVFEWCADFYHFDTPTRRTANSYIEDRPSGRRVLKGGAWTTGDDRIRLAARWSYTPDLRDNILGFRLAFDAPAPFSGRLLRSRRLAPAGGDERPSATREAEIHMTRRNQ